MNHAEQSFRESNPTQMNRVDFPNGRTLTFTGKTVAEIFGAVGKKNSVFFDPDKVGRLVHIQGDKGPANMFISLFFHGIIPTTHIIRGQSCLGDTKKSGKKFRNRETETREEYFSVEFNPDRIQETYSHAQYLAGECLLHAFGDGDHASKQQNVASNAKGNKFYFYDFLLDIKRLDRFFEEIANPQNKINVLTKEDVRREFSKLIKALHNQYIGEEGEMLFSAIYKKSRLPLSDFQKIKNAFYTQLNRLFQMYVLKDESK